MKLVPLPEDQLPLMLPDIDELEPTDEGESPLSKCEDCVNTTCPQCGGPGKRETDVMPNWAGSSWYFIRYCDPDNSHGLASKERSITGCRSTGITAALEHVTLHLLYSRFWAQFLYDIGVISAPSLILNARHTGMILGEKTARKCQSQKATL